MIIIITLIFLLIVFAALLANKSPDSPIIIFAGLWMSILMLYSMHLYGIYDVTIKTQLILFLGIMFVLLGYLICRKVKIRDHVEYYDKQVNYSVITIISIVIVLSSLSFYLANIKLVLAGMTVQTLKEQLVTGEIGWGGAWMQYAVRPCEYIIAAISAYCLIMDRKQRIIIACGMILIIFEFVGVGSKTSIAFYAICLIMTYWNNRDALKNELGHVSKAPIIPAIFIGIIIIVRSGFEKLYFYLCGCIPLLDQVVTNDFYTEFGNTYGFLSFNSAIRLLIKTLSVLGINIDSELFDTANRYFNRFEVTTTVSAGRNYNAFHTMWGDFYVDLGMLGVVVFSFIFGIVICYYQRRFEQYHSLDTFVINCLLMYYIIFSPVRFQMSNTFFGLMLIYSILFLKTILYGSSRFRIGNLKI